MSDNYNPFTLFLILLLLVLSSDKQADIKLGFIRGLIDQTSRSLYALREGIDGMHSGFEYARTVFINHKNKQPDDPH